jgi:phosphoheptose isomerase
VRSPLTTRVNAAEHLAAEIAEHAAVASRTRDSMATEFRRLVDACANALRSGHKLLLFGNGGAAATAQHIATELVVRYNRESGRLAELVDHRIFVPSTSTARVQEMHMVLGHALCAPLEKDAGR